MSFIKTMAGLFLLSLSLLSHAGAWRPTSHSRANCNGFNESVTWHGGHSYWWRVESQHFPPGWTVPLHVIDTEKEYTWRAAAYHATEAYALRGDAWNVIGFHFNYPNEQERLEVMTTASDCNIYDGWWN